MKIRTLIYYITVGFILGTLILIAVQYISSNNARELISGNESLLKEYKVSNELLGLQKDLLLLDNKIKAAVTTGDSAKIRDFEAGISRIREDAGNLKKTNESDTTLKYMQELDRLIGQKIDFSHQTVDSFFQAGKPSAEDVAMASRNTKFSETITNLAHRIDTSGRVALAQKIKTVDRSGQRVLSWNLYMIFLVLILFTAVFLIIIDRMKKQADLISQLNTSEKKLKQAAFIKENFLANMSHEIRTPLNAILGYTNLLERKKLDDDARLHVLTVRKSGETLLSIVNDILDLSKIESGMMRIEEAPFSLSGLIHSVDAMFHHKVEEKGLTLNISLADNIPDVLIGDATRLTQILVNLVGNAVKFTLKGQIDLQVSALNDDPNHFLLAFRITDTGIGIDKESLETIFERFRQAEDSTTRKYGGTGLGLSIVRDLVYLQNGEIEVKSKPGSGTNVLVTIPYKISARPDYESRSASMNPARRFFPALKILVAEDNEINQGLMSHFLSDWGIENTLASNGKEAIALLQSDTFDLVLMDIQMPEMDGYEATRYIRQQLKLEVPIIAMTAHAMQADREKCLSNGMNEHLSKPIRESELQNMIARFTGSQLTQTQLENVVNNEIQTYKRIRLDYMKEISKGDVTYEKLVTEQFIQLVPEELAALSKASENPDPTALRQIAHSIKTSVSIMGLDTLLQEHLDALEYETLENDALRHHIERVVSISREAIEEAKDFYIYLKDQPTIPDFQ